MKDNQKSRISRREFLKDAGAMSAVSILAMTGGSLLTGCTTETAGPVHVRFQPSWIPNIQNGGIYAGISEGFYQAAGLDVEILPGGPGILGGAVIDSGDAELGEMSSSVDLVKIFSQGTRLQTFATVFQRSPAGLMYVETDAEGNAVNSFPEGPASLVGKRVGIQGGVNLPWKVMCAEAGVDPEADFEIINVGFDPTPLLDGTVDAYWCFLTNQPGMLRSMGYGIGEVDSYEWGYKVPGNFYAAKPDYIEENFDLVKSWLGASVEGWEYNNSHVSEMAAEITELTTEQYGTDASQQEVQGNDQISFMNSSLTEEKGLMYINLEDWENAIRIMNDIGELETIPNVEDFATTALLDALA